MVDRIRTGLIGLDGPYGPRRITYADYTASGRSLDFLEEFTLRQVLPRYANTHTESSGTGLWTARLGLRMSAHASDLRRQARPDTSTVGTTGLNLRPLDPQSCPNDALTCGTRESAAWCGSVDGG
jgi:hypothetical protein